MDAEWTDPTPEPGICILCARCQPECLQSTQGWICRACWQKTLRAPNPPNTPGRLAIVPDSGLRGYMLIDADLMIVTIDGTLYFFRQEKHALEILGRLQKQELGRGTHIIQVSALVPFLYVNKHPELKLVFVKDVIDPAELEGKL